MSFIDKLDCKSSKIIELEIVLKVSIFSEQLHVHDIELHSLHMLSKIVYRFSLLTGECLRTCP